MLHRKIHILSVIDDLHFGGDEYRLLAFGQSLDRERFDHTVLTLMKEDSVVGEKYGSMREQCRQAGIRLVDLGQPAGGTGEQTKRPISRQLFTAWEKIHKLTSIIRQQKVDVLDVHLSPANPVCALAARSAGIPFVVTLYQISSMQSSKLWLMGQFNLGSAALLITDSESTASLVGRWLMRRRPVRVIPNGTLPPQPEHARPQMLKFFNLPDRPITIIGQISSLLPYKGHLVLLDAAKRVLEQRPGCFFLLVGYERSERGYRDVLLGRAGSLGIADRVRIAGYPGSIGDVWNLIDIHVHASQFDSLPNALLEAMSLGKPSVITSVGGVPEVVKHGVNGFLAAPNNPEQLAANLLLLVRDRNLRATIGQRAQDTYAKCFRPQVMTSALEKVFACVVGRGAIPNRRGN